MQIIEAKAMAAQAVGIVQAAPDFVAAALHDGSTLDRWNPAIRVIEMRAPGEYAIKAHGLSGRLSYVRSSTSAGVTMQLVVPGLTEEGSWTLEPSLFGTRVEHSIQWKGPLAHLIGSGEMRRVPALRIARLRDWVLLQAGVTA